jgi:D-alanyl-D-alanine dipeptidase
MRGRPTVPTVERMVVLLADTAVTSIPAQDNSDPLVELAAFGVAYSGSSRTGAFVRVALAERLAAAQEALPAGIRLLVNEGHRSPDEQRRIIASYTETLRQQHPELDEFTLRRLSSRFVAPLEVAPHVAGAAVDLTLADDDGPLWMGTPIDATPEESHDACMFAATTISADARSHRNLLAGVLEAQGLVNYPTEWWHWSYGDRYWAYATRSASALYGPISAGVAAAG